MKNNGDFQPIVNKPIAQEHPMGCAVACVASLLGISYRDAWKLFGNPELSMRGIYCPGICRALGNAGKEYSYSRLASAEEIKPGAIVFIEKGGKYPCGHYLLKTERGWMNPWINFPNITPAKAGFSKKLPGKPQWVLSEK